MMKFDSHEVYKDCSGISSYTLFVFDKDNFEDGIRLTVEVFYDFYGEDIEFTLTLRNESELKVLNYDKPGCLRQVSLGLDRIALFYKNKNNRIVFRTFSKELADSLAELEGWIINGMDSEIYVVEKRAAAYSSDIPTKKMTGYDYYLRAISNTAC